MKRYGILARRTWMGRWPQCDQWVPRNMHRQRRRGFTRLTAIQRRAYYRQVARWAALFDETADA